LDLLLARIRSIGNRDAPSLFDRLLDVSSGIRDFEFAVTLVRYYLTSVIFLSAIFLVFTAFELWKFAGAFDGGTSLLGRYMVYILPFIYLQIAPISAMLATIATYAIKSGQNEIVGWVSSGVSGYRLMVPSLVLLVVFGAVNFAVGEYIAPYANRQQDKTRSLLRSKGLPAESRGESWQKGDSAFYGKVRAISASDNDVGSGGPQNMILAVLREGLGSKRQILYRAPSYDWSAGRLSFAGKTTRLNITPDAIVEDFLSDHSLREPADPFAPRLGNPNHLSLSDLRSGAEASPTESTRSSYRLAYSKRLSLAITPLFFGLVGIAFGLKLTRKGNAVAVAKAVFLSLLYLVAAGVCDQLGRSGALPPEFAVWGPISVFLLVAIFFTSRMRT
jgi:lipopolysaccharide export system permease protein